jgi:flavin-dependent dehydrogenase
MITIIGAGHAGCYAGNLLAKKGYKVNIWEKNPVIGKPMQCTGIVTRDIDDLIKLPKKIIHTTIHHARIHAPNKKYIKVKLKNGNYILKRTKFVQYMAELAESQGVKILTKKKYPSNSPLRSNQIIDASGPLARPSHHINKRKRIYLEAPQILAEYDNDNIIDMYTNIGTFAWVTPVTKNTALIGLLAYKNSLKLMKNTYPGAQWRLSPCI